MIKKLLISVTLVVILAGGVVLAAKDRSPLAPAEVYIIGVQEEL